MDTMNARLELIVDTTKNCLSFYDSNTEKFIPLDIMGPYAVQLNNFDSLKHDTKNLIIEFYSTGNERLEPLPRAQIFNALAGTIPKYYSAKRSSYDGPNTITGEGINPYIRLEVPAECDIYIGSKLQSF